MTSPGAPSIPPTSSRLHGEHDPYFVHTVPVCADFRSVPRQQIFAQLLTGKRVLHVGYADWPITDVSANLHVQLDRVCAQLDGLDPNDEAAEVIGPLVKGRLFQSWGEVTDEYDALLVPEVMEHVGDVEGFLAELDAAPAPTVILTVPDVLQARSDFFDYDVVRQIAVEVVHPDHNCWYSPYTLTNVVRKYTTWSIQGVWFINGISLMLIAHKQPAGGAEAPA